MPRIRPPSLAATLVQKPTGALHRPPPRPPFTPQPPSKLAAPPPPPDTAAAAPRLHLDPAPRAAAPRRIIPIHAPPPPKAFSLPPKPPPPPPPSPSTPPKLHRAKPPRHRSFHHPVATPGFTPRDTFEISHSLPKTYFLGHHAKALREIRDSLASVHLIIECRDARLPLTTWNPDLEAATAGRSRIVVYTKADLLGGDVQRDRNPKKTLRRYLPVLDAAAASPASGLVHEGYVVLQPGDRKAHRQLLDIMARVARHKDVLTGLQAMVVGMPNVGKSTLLNFLRTRGMQGKLGGSGRVPKVAQTGQQPGITRSIGTSVRVLDTDPPVFVKDTPGVFVPYVPDPESMIKLALVAGVKQGMVPDVQLADYLLYRMNLVSPRLYELFQPTPTNDVHEFLEGVARATHKLRRGGLLDLDTAASFVVHRFRDGKMGHFPLDEMTEEAIERKMGAAANPVVSPTQAKKQAKELRLRLSRQRHSEKSAN